MILITHINNCNNIIEIILTLILMIVLSIVTKIVMSMMMMKMKMRDFLVLFLRMTHVNNFYYPLYY